MSFRGLRLLFFPQKKNMKGSKASNNLALVALTTVRWHIFRLLIFQSLLQFLQVELCPLLPSAGFFRYSSFFKGKYCCCSNTSAGFPSCSNTPASKENTAVSSKILKQVQLVGLLRPRPSAGPSFSLKSPWAILWWPWLPKTTKRFLQLVA